MFFYRKIKIIYKWFFYAVVCITLAACSVDSVQVKQILTPIAPLAINQVAWVDFEFDALDEDDTIAHPNGLIVLQVPANWLIISAYLGNHANDNILRHQLIIDTPTQLQPETGLAEPMQLVTFYNNYREQHGISGSFANYGRLLFVPALNAQGDGINTFAENIKVVYGQLENNTFLPLSPTSIAEDNFANVGLPTETVSRNLLGTSISLNETANAEITSFQRASNQGDSVSFTIKGGENLLNRYGYRLFLSHSSDFSGTALPLLQDVISPELSLPLGSFILHSEPEEALDDVYIIPSALDAAASYYIDVPVLSKHSLNVEIADYIWQYTKAIVLTTNMTPPSEIKGTELDKHVLDASYINGRIVLPDDQRAPQGGMNFIVNLSYRVFLPEGENSIPYRAVIQLNRPFFPHSTISVRCESGCSGYSEVSHYYATPNMTLDLAEAKRFVKTDAIDNINLTLSILETVTIEGNLSQSNGERLPADDLFPANDSFSVSVSANGLLNHSININDDFSYRIIGQASTLSMFTLSASCSQLCDEKFSPTFYSQSQVGLVDRSQATVLSVTDDLSAINIQFTSAEEVIINGTIRLEAGQVAAENGLGFLIGVLGLHNGIRESFFLMPAGQQQFDYQVRAFILPNASFGLFLSCTSCENILRSPHYYNIKGTVTDQRQHSLITGSSIHNGIDFDLTSLLNTQIKGRLSLPKGQVAKEDIHFQIYPKPSQQNFGDIFIITAGQNSIEYALNFGLLSDEKTNLVARCASNCAGLWRERIYYHPAASVIKQNEAELIDSGSFVEDINIEFPLLQPFTTGYKITDDLAIQAIIHTVEQGLINAVWRYGGEENTARGDKVIWGYFYADPADVKWGSMDNPEVFVKIWFDISGRIDVNYFHVSVPDIQVHTAYQSTETQFLFSQSDPFNRRYVRHFFNPDGSAEIEENLGHNPFLQGDNFALKQQPQLYDSINALNIGTLIETETAGLLDGTWLMGGSADTARGDQVAWGYFYADPDVVSWGSVNNPEVFVKIWFDKGGWIDVNYFHVSVPRIGVYSELEQLMMSSISMPNSRYIQHKFFR